MQKNMPYLLPQTVKKYSGKTVLVVGAARSGAAAAELLLNIGAKVILNDSKPLSNFPSLPKALFQEGCSLQFGQPAEPFFDMSDMLLISPGIAIDAPLIIKARAKGLEIVGEMEFAASLASQDLIAVSGTNGKTTTVSLLGEIISQAGKIAQVAGNIGYPLSGAVLSAKADDILIAEVSSFQLETTKDFHPRAAALLNITPDHLDRHKDMETYIKLKKKLFSNMGEQDTAVLNYDDPIVRQIAQDIKAKVVWFSSSGVAPYGALAHEGKIAFLLDGEYRALCKTGDLKIPGQHNIQNALAATALAYSLGVPFPVIAYALKTFAGVEHRIEFTRTLNGVRYLNDSKGTNPDSTVKAVESMSAPTVLIAGGYDKMVAFDALASAIVNSGNIKQVVLLGQTRDKIASALRAVSYQNLVMAESLQEAVKEAAKHAVTGGNVLFSPACASFDMFHDYEERGRVFKEIVHHLDEEA